MLKRMLIKDCVYENDSNCYDEAIKLLDAEYGNQHLIVNAYLRELRRWPLIKQNDATALKKFHRFLRTGLTHKKDGKLKELDSESLIRGCILAKMHRSAQEKWVDKVVRARENKKLELGFSEVVKFVGHQSLLASDPSYS